MIKFIQKIDILNELEKSLKCIHLKLDTRRLKFNIPIVIEDT